MDLFQIFYSMAINEFTKYFDLGSLLPTFLFLSGFTTLYLFSIQSYSYGFIFLMISFVIYVINNILINYLGYATIFNEYLEDIASYVAFSLSSIVFGLLYFQESYFMVFVVFFYALSEVLSLSRNWVSRVKNSRGWPIALNGIFFPFSYYLVTVVIQGFAEAIFLVYYISVAMFSISDKNFLGYQEEIYEDNVVEIRKIKKE